MSLLLRTETRGVYRSQPKGNAVINFDHPLSKNMTFDMTASLGFVNNVTNAQATTTVGASTIPSSQGLGYGVSQSAGNCIYFSNQVILTAFPFSILIVADTRTEANRKFMFQFGANSGSASARVWVLFNGTATSSSSSDSSGKIYLYTIDTSLNQNSPAAGGIASSIIDGVHSYGITCDSTTTSYYRDGKLLGTESPTNTNPVWTSLGITSINGAAPALSNARPFDRSQVLTRFWNGRLLTEQDYRSLYENPWQIYMARAKDKWIFPPISAGGDVTVSASAQALSLSLQTPVVTTTSSVTVSPTAQSLSLTLQSPVISVGGGVTVTPTAQSITSSLQSVTVTGTALVSPAAQSLSLTQQTPVVSVGGNISFSVSAQALTLTAQAPTLQGAANISPTAQSLTFSQPSPTMSGTSVIVTTPIALNLFLHAPLFGPSSSPRTAPIMRITRSIDIVLYRS